MSLSGWGQILLTLVVATLCFMIGGLNPATVVGRARGVDIASVGSGNPGATNLGRALGRKWGILVGVLDVLKGFVPTLLALLTLGTWVALFAGLACVLGHIYSPYLGGRGGKGVATSIGVVLAVAPWVALLAVGVFLVTLPFVKRLGHASIVATAALVVAGLVVAIRASTHEGRGVGIWLMVVAIIVLARHRSNIRAWLGRVVG